LDSESPPEAYYSTESEKKGGFGIGGVRGVSGTRGSLNGGGEYVLPEIFRLKIFKKILKL
jgi:hypothetical protein